MAKPIRQATRTLQTLRGAGQVFAASKFLSDVRYTITVQQGIVQAGSQPTSGATDIKGTLVILEGERNLKHGARLVLKMEDGRTAEFVTASGTAAEGVYSIQVSKLSDRA
jgi:hypothetical protein